MLIIQQAANEPAAYHSAAGNYNVHFMYLQVLKLKFKEQNAKLRKSSPHSGNSTILIFYF